MPAHFIHALIFFAIFLCTLSTAVRLKTKDSNLGPAAGIAGISMFLLVLCLEGVSIIATLDHIRDLLAQQ